MNVWFAIPTQRPDKASRCFAAWQAKGYRTAAAINRDGKAPANADAVLRLDEYRGYGDACNQLAALLRGADIIVFAGDDVMPHKGATATKIAGEFAARFPDLNGVMQPTGDPFGMHDQCCQSPWIGREFIERTYGGNGPYWPGYFHYWVDAELYSVAMSMGVLWKRPDLSQYHDHWQRRGEQRPADLLDAAARWKDGKDLYEQRKATGFPGAIP